MSRRLQIIESNYGRDQGWFVEVQGRTLAVLTDCRFEDMFWDSYRVEPTAADPEQAALVQSEEFWNRLDVYQPVIRDRAFGEVAPNAFAAWREPGLGVSLTGRVSMRGLYLVVPSCPWDGLVLCSDDSAGGPRHDNGVPTGLAALIAAGQLGFTSAEPQRFVQ
jgi:hypothetical protein